MHACISKLCLICSDESPFKILVESTLKGCYWQSIHKRHNVPCGMLLIGSWWLTMIFFISWTKCVSILLVIGFGFLKDHFIAKHLLRDFPPPHKYVCTLTILFSLIYGFLTTCVWFLECNSTGHNMYIGAKEQVHCSMAYISVIIFQIL